MSHARDPIPQWQWEFIDPGPRPDVSVVICAYGKVRMTLDCLWAIHEAQLANSALVEVIVVDDASPDDTTIQLAKLRGLQLVTLTENGGYLRAANRGIEAARGRHILMLNNDTLPQGRWIDPLLETMQTRGALAVGSKLVFADGTVQEAGGIIFSDGSGWNFGRGGDPDNPAFRYERRVDYCSAASLLIDGEFLRARGGFDVRYAPAYYEDTDACFAVREVGGEVWFQPSSVVVHLEGQSHGTDENSGLKRYQVLNRETFITRHATALRQQQPPGAEHVMVARERVRSRVIVVDNEVPTADRDSGSLRLFSIMRGLVRDGYGVTFLPVNGWRRPPYTRRLEAEGVEVLGTEDTWWPHLESLKESVSHVWLSRPDVTQRYLSKFGEVLPNARIVYDTVDLHFLREQRAADVGTQFGEAPDAKATRQLEIGLMKSVDDVVVVSPVEQQLLIDEEGIAAAIVPNVHTTVDNWASPNGREGILFVGNFRHPPNADGVQWLVDEVMPSVWEHNPELRLRIIGPDAPAEILSLNDDPRIDVLGWVPDLAPFYASSRVVVAPLRFGAGLKGKVGEALSHGVASVLTPVAAEGMPLVSGEHALIEEEPLAFASAIAVVCADDVLWQRLSTQGRQLIAQNYSPVAVRTAVRTLLGGAVDGVSDETVGATALPLRSLESAERYIADADRERSRLRVQLTDAKRAGELLTEQIERLRSDAFAEVGSEVGAEGKGHVAMSPALAPSDRGSDDVRDILTRALTQASAAREVQAGRSYRIAQGWSRLRRRTSSDGVPAGVNPEHLAALAVSGLFDSRWYRANYPDVAAAGVDPFEHYTTQGWREGRSPGPAFDTAWYLATYPDVAESDIDPAVHYVVWGWQEGRRPTSWALPIGTAAAVPAAPEPVPEPAPEPVYEPEPEFLPEPAVVVGSVTTEPREPLVFEELEVLDVPGVRILHVHGFKCAGTTFNWILERNYPGRVRYVESESIGRRLPWQRIRDEVDLSDARAVTSHLTTVPDVDAGLAAITVAFVREPLARLISAYRFEQRSTSPRFPGEPFANYLRRIVNTVESNYQSRLLSPQHFVASGPFLGWQLDPHLIDLDRPDLFVGVVERFDESMVLLEHRLASLGITFDGAYQLAENVSSGVFPTEPGWSGETRLADYDRLLHRRADTILSAQLGSLPDAEGALAEYRARCDALRESDPQVSLPENAQWTYLPPVGGEPAGRKTS